MSHTSVLTLTPSPVSIIDELGNIRSEIKRLEALDKDLAAHIKALGAGKYAGAVFSATAYEVKGRVSTDWQAIALKLADMHGFDISHQLITAHTTTGTPSLSVKTVKI